MKFLLRSEIETHDIDKGYMKKQPRCPTCHRTQVRLLNKTGRYTKYQCWNRFCEDKGQQFIVIEDYIAKEKVFEPFCADCGEPLQREFENSQADGPFLVFRCNGKMCETCFEPYRYNLKSGQWEGKLPSFRHGEDSEPPINVEPASQDLPREHQSAMKKSSHTSQIKTKRKYKGGTPKVDARRTLEHNIKKSKELSELEKTRQTLRKMFPVGSIPLLTMDAKKYGRLLFYHNEKVAVFVDVPNLIRTLRGLFRRDFEGVLIKAHEMLLQFIEGSFSTDTDYIIRYYSKPDDDLAPSNQILRDFCEIGRASCRERVCVGV